ncbi:hypothetical protein HY524_00975 [Candidatus Berkelbacteria bacterium]|nr:hypothetical protein [Candidatus Berkelbacteria bacterium]
MRESGRSIEGQPSYRRSTVRRTRPLSLLERSGLGLAAVAVWAGLGDGPSQSQATFVPAPARAIVERSDRVTHASLSRLENEPIASRRCVELPEGHFVEIGHLPSDQNELAATQFKAPDPHQYLGSEGFTRLWGDTHNHASFDDGLCGCTKLFELALARQDFVIHTPHAEQIDVAEANQLARYAADCQREGKLLGIGSEWTGSTETKSANPGHNRSQGHVLMYGTSTRIGQMSLRGGQPDKIVVLFSELLTALPMLTDLPMGVFAHPSLYSPKETFDLDGQPPGYDPPPSSEAIVAMKGCELTSHGPPATGATVGLGDGINFATSNEACYRRLLRGGWQLSPYMGTDWHLPGYKAGPYTCVWARQRSIDAVYDAMEERLTCGTEAYGISIALTGQQRVPSDEKHSLIQPIVMMGQTMFIDPEADKVFFQTSLRDRSNKPVQTKELGLVEVFRDSSDDVDSIALDKERCRTSPIYRQELERQHRFADCSSGVEIVRLYYRSDRRPVVADQALVCVYAKATLPGGKQLISAPIFFRY